MQAREVASLPQGEDWLYELLWGGERVRATKHAGGVQLFSRDGREVTNRFPRVAAAVARMRAETAVLDGEILQLDSCSRESFAFLAQAADDLSPSRVVLLAYDLLHEDGRDVRPLPLLGRRVLLASAVQGTPIVVAPLVPGPADAALVRAARLRGRGIVAKRGGSAYRPNSLNNDWVKVTLPPAGLASPARRIVAALAAAQVTRVTCDK